MRKNSMPSKDAMRGIGILIPSIKWKNYTCQIQAGGSQKKAQGFGTSALVWFEA